MFMNLSICLVMFYYIVFENYILYMYINFVIVYFEFLSRGFIKGRLVVRIKFCLFGLNI